MATADAQSKTVAHADLWTNPMAPFSTRLISSANQPIAGEAGKSGR